MRLTPAHLLCAAAYAVDMTTDRSPRHGWRVAILAYQIAKQICPNIASDVFFAGLLHDAGEVGALSSSESGNESMVCQKSATLLRWLPGMSTSANCMESMYDLYGGLKLSDEADSESTFEGSQVLRLADAVDQMGCFNGAARLADNLKAICVHTGNLWTKEIWAALVNSLREPAFYNGMSDAKLHTLMSETLKDIKNPADLDNDAGIERILHIIATLVDVKDPSTAGHSLRVAKFAVQLAKHIGLSDEDCKTVYYAGLVHDCGRLGLPDSLFKQVGRLNKSDLALMRGHAEMTIRALSCIPDNEDMIELANIAGHDHERYDGNGYPDGLAGDKINILSRILSVADAFDAMITPSEYRLLSPRAAVMRLRQGEGAQFDPIVVEAMVSVVNAGESVSEAVAA